jgi:hypothetical protein
MSVPKMARLGNESTKSAPYWYIACTRSEKDETRKEYGVRSTEYVSSVLVVVVGVAANWVVVKRTRHLVGSVYSVVTYI